MGPGIGFGLQQPTNTNQLQNKGLILAGITAISWGLLAIGLKLALRFFDAYTIVWIRYAVSAITLLCYYTLVKPRALKILIQPGYRLVGAALLLGLNYIGFMQGVVYAGPAASQILIQLGAITLGIAGVVVWKEKITPLRKVGFALALGGFVLFYAQQLHDFGYQSASLTQGVVWLVTAAWSWTGYAMLSKLLVQKIAPQQMNMFLYTLPTLLLIPWVDFGAFFQPLPWWAWLLLLFLCLNTLIAYGTLAEALRHADANRVSMVIALNPILTFAILELLVWSKAQWFEIPGCHPLTYLGAMAVIAGAAMATGIQKKKT